MFGPVMLVCGFLVFLFASDKAHRAAVQARHKPTVYPTLAVQPVVASDSVRTLRRVMGAKRG